MTAVWRRCTALWIAACVWMLGLPSLPARAAMEPTTEESSARVAVLPLDVAGELSEADRAGLSAELVEGLERGAFEVVGPESVAQTSPTAASCENARCLAKVAAQTGATHVLRARVTVVDRDYTVEVELFDGETGRSLANTDEACEICGIADAGAMMGTAAATLRNKLDALATGPSTLSITSDPNGAEVRLDGEIIGVTPLERPVIPGKAVVRVSKEGFIAIEREVQFVEGVEETLAFELDKVPSRLPSRPWGWVSLGVGAAAVGTAVAFAVLGGTEREFKLGDRCSGANRDADGDCREVWNTEWHALGFGLAGGALTTLGIAILLNSASRKKSADGELGARAGRRGRRPRVGLGWRSVSLSGRF